MGIDRSNNVRKKNEQAKMCEIMEKNIKNATFYKSNLSEYISNPQNRNKIKRLSGDPRAKSKWRLN